jgi:splicing factor 3B subunit 3
MQWPHFAVRPLANLEPIDEMESLSPILDCKIANLSHDDTPQFYTACGRGHRSSFRILRHGLEVTELAVSPLPGNASAIWTCRRNINGTPSAEQCSTAPA